MRTAPRRLLTAVTITLCYSVTGQSLGGQPISVERLPGCYDLEFGGWDAPADVELDSLRWRPPPRVELSRAEPQMTSGYDLRSAPNSVPTPHSRTSWRLTDSGTVRVHWGNGFVGMSGELEVSGDTLTGTLRTQYDAQPSPTYEGPLRATRVDCASPPDVPFESQRFLARSVDLEGGFSITLGEPVRPRSEILGDFNVTAYFVRRGSVGTFGGSGDVRVRVAEGDTVVGIRLEYPAGEFEPLLRRIVEEVGEPTGPSTPAVPGHQIRWENRRTWITLQRPDPISPNERVTLTIRDPRYPRYWIPEEERGSRRNPGEEGPEPPGEGG